MDFKYIRKLKPFIILSMILIFMPIVTKAGGIVPTDFNGFAVTSEGVIVIGDNTAVTGWVNNEKMFSFELPLKTDYALSVNQDDNIVVYTQNARFVFSQDGKPLTFSEKGATNIAELKNRKVISTNDGVCYVLTNKFGFVNTITKVENGNQTIVYRTPTTVLLVELAFWEGNLLLVVASFAALLDVRKRRFVKNNKEKSDEEKRKIELPKFLKAFKPPEIQNKGAAFSSEYSTKPGEMPGFLETAKKEESKTNENDINEATKSN